MAYNYDKLYGERRDALGHPSAFFVDFFDRFDLPAARILDVGCGQGRDAVFIARLGHHVVGVDISSNGIRDLQAVAATEELPIKGIVADIADYEVDGQFDVMVIDRTLHMLPKSTGLSVLRRLLSHVNKDGWLLIADEKSNIQDFLTVIAQSDHDWATRVTKKAQLAAQRV